MDDLIRFVLPDKCQSRFHGLSSPPAGCVHAARTVLQMLWAGGDCPSVPALELYAAINRRDEWTESDADTLDDGMRLARLRQVIHRINERIKASREWQQLAIIKANRIDHTYRLILDSRRIRMIHLGYSDVEIQMLSPHVSGGRPQFKSGELIKFRFCSSMAGYLHIFHIEHYGRLDRLFPKEGASRVSVKQDEVIEYPAQCFLAGFGFAVGSIADPQRNRIGVVVTRKKVEVTAADLKKHELFCACRGVIRSILFIKPLFRHLTPSEIALGDAIYYAVPRRGTSAKS